MLSLWKCDHCHLKNYPENEKCQACFRKATRLSPIDQLKHEQRILFHGFLRIELSINKLIPTDIINLGMKYYEITIESRSTPNELIDLIEECGDNRECFMAYKLSKLLTIVYPMDESYHCQLGWSLSIWNLHDQAEIEYSIAVQLDPNDADLRDS